MIARRGLNSNTIARRVLNPLIQRLGDAFSRHPPPSRPGTQNPEPQIRNPKAESQIPDPGTPNPEPETKNSKPETLLQDMSPQERQVTRPPKPETRN